MCIICKRNNKGADFSLVMLRKKLAIWNIKLDISEIQDRKTKINMKEK